jgi:hypothetical protein
MLGKNGIFRGKSFEKSFFQEIPRNFPRKVIFRGKMYEKLAPVKTPEPILRLSYFTTTTPAILGLATVYPNFFSVHKATLGN